MSDEVTFDRVFTHDDAQSLLTKQTDIKNSIDALTTAVGNINNTAVYDGSGNVITATYAPLSSPALTGNPTAPTQLASDSSTKVATTAFVHGHTDDKAPLASPAFTGTPTAPTPAATDNSTKLATTTWVQSAFNVMKLLPTTNVTQGVENDTHAFWKAQGNCFVFFDQLNMLNGQPSRWGYVVNRVNGNEVNQEFLSTYGIFYRFANGQGGQTTMPAWKQIAETNKTLQLTGGTMTGQLIINRVPDSANGRSNILCVGNTQNFVLASSATSVTKGTAPSSNNYWGIEFFGADINTNNRIALLETALTTGNDCSISLAAYRCDTNTDLTQCRITVVCNNDGSRRVVPGADNDTDLGYTNGRWKQLYAGTTTISTSDERLKDNITAIPDEVLDAWGEVNWYQYQFKDSIAEKGENARLHTGAIAQRIESIFSAHGLDANRYGLLCYDEWKAESAQRDRDGNIVQPACPAGNRYSLRYEEALCMEAAYQRRRADRLEARIEALERVINHE